MIPFVLTLVFWGGATAAGVVLGRRSVRSAAITAGVCAFLVLVRVFLRFHPDIEDAVFPWDWYVPAHPWWVFAPALGAVAAGAGRMSTPVARIGVGVFAVLLFTVATRNLALTVFADPETYTGIADRRGDVRQSTDHSCGAAAAATMANRLGVPADERTMAERCHTNAFLGTDALGVAHGLRATLGENWTVRIERSTWDRLATTPLPAAAVVKFQLWVDHWVVVLESEADSVVVSDPAGRVRRLSRAEFLDRWRGLMVTARRR
ncbi:MAG: hypothetical protein HUU15_10570 [Candidatus Brocadiae bacterium]|nr:hypothetical protein [Candidatus Brocadiia bacterium]